MLNCFKRVRTQMVKMKRTLRLRLNSLSLKARLALFVIILFQLNAVLIISFYGVFTAKSIEARVLELQSTIAIENQVIIDGLTTLTENAQDIAAFLEDVAEKQHMSIKVYDTEGRLKYDVNKRGGFVGYRSKDYVIINGTVKYILELDYRFDIEALRQQGGFAQIRNFSFVLMFIDFVLLILFFNWQVTNPIRRIQCALKTVTPENPLVNLSYSRADEIGDLCRHFEGLGLALKEANRIQDETLSAISHDLRTPLTTIMGYTERLMTKPNLSEAKKMSYYDIINQKAIALYELSEGMLNTQQLLTDLSLHSITTRDLLENIEREIRIFVQNHDVDVILSVTEGRCGVVEIDADRMMRSIQNVCANALSYAWPEGNSGSKPKVIRLDAKCKASVWCLRLEDNGVGLEHDELPHVMERFWRGEKSRSRHTGGVGLGMALFADLIKKMHGTIEVYNVPEGGFGIEITLPLIDDTF